MIFLVNWWEYGYCSTCSTHAQEPCKGRFRIRACKGRESYYSYLKRYARILTTHYQREIKPEEVEHYISGGI